MKKLLLIFILLIPITHAYFEESQCECPGNGLEVVNSRVQGNLLKCQWRPTEYEKEWAIPSMGVEVWTFIYDYEMPNLINKTKQRYEERTNDPDFEWTIEMYEIDENRVAMVSYVGNEQYPGQREGGITHAYKGYDIGIGSRYFEENINDKLLATEECMMDAVDLHIRRQKEIYANKEKMLFSLDDRPLRKMYVRVDYSTKFTDENGMLVLDQEYDEIEDFDIFFRHEYDYGIYSGDTQDPLWIEIDVEDGKIDEMIVHAGEEEKEIKPNNPMLKDFDLASYEELLFYTYNYMYFQDALEFYILKGVEFEEGLKIITNVKYEPGAAYENRKIIMDDFYANPGNAHAPYVQYHEFSHYVMHTMYGDVWDEITKTKNHGGFANPSTADSWAEGFAEFMPTQIAKHVDFYWADRPSQKDPSIYPPAGSLDTNYKSWDHEGKAEEFAIAGVLWDFVDNTGMDDLSLAGLDIAFAIFFRHADLDGDETVTKEEYLFHQFYMTGASIEMDYGDWKTMIGLWYPLKDAFKDIEPDMTIFDKYKGDDEILDSDELISMAEIMNYEFKDEVAEEWIDAHDADEDGIISRQEVQTLLKEYEIIKTLTDGEEVLDKKDWKRIAKDKEMQDKVWEFEDKEYVTFEQMAEQMKKNAIAGDDDGLNMDFDELWGMMTTPHPNFYHFLEEVLVGRDDEFKKDFAAILIDHGIFIDMQEGNKQYDEGEAFIDLNEDNKRQENETYIDYPLVWNFDEKDDLGVPSNYERPQRASPLILAGHNVENAKQVSYIIWDKGRIRQAYTIETDGYVPVPPDAQIFAANDKDSVSFSTQAFENNYQEIKAQGYIQKLKSAKRPDDEISSTIDGKSTGSKLWIWLILVIAFVILYKRYTKK